MAGTESTPSRRRADTSPLNCARGLPGATASAEPPAQQVAGLALGERAVKGKRASSGPAASPVQERHVPGPT